MGQKVDSPLIRAQRGDIASDSQMSHERLKVYNDTNIVGDGERSRNVSKFQIMSDPPRYEAAGLSLPVAVHAARVRCSRSVASGP